MAKTRYLYEVLVRGTPTGGLEHAHVQHLTLHTDDETGEQIGHKLECVPLAVPEVEAVLGGALTGLLAQIQQLQTENALLRDGIRQMVGEQS